MLTGIKLKPKSKRDCNQFKIVVSADENDGDYKYSTTTFSEDEAISYLIAIDAISSLPRRVEGSDDYPDSLTEDQKDLLNDILPSSEYTIHDIYIDSFEYTDSAGITFDVEFDLALVKQTYPEKFI